jgi:CRP-like cAMP-binding protein
MLPSEILKMSWPADRDTTPKTTNFDYQDFVAAPAAASVSDYRERHVVYSQGDAADALFCIVSGSVKITVISEHGKEGVISLLGSGDFFGEDCLTDSTLRPSTATTASTSKIARFGKDAIERAICHDSTFCHAFIKYLLVRNERLKVDLTDHLFNSSEKRLARILLTLANVGSGEQSSVIAIPVTQETLAAMVGTTRSRINQFMTKFRRLGHIEYNGQITVRNSLHNIILEEQAQSHER